MHKTNTPQCTILWQKCTHVCTFLLRNGALWDMGMVHCENCAVCKMVAFQSRPLCVKRLHFFGRENVIITMSPSNKMEEYVALTHYFLRDAIISKWLSLLLTHWGRVTHICVSKLTIIGSDNGLSPDRRQAIIWTNDKNMVDFNLRNKLQWNLKRNSCIFIQENAFENVVCEMASIFLGLNVLRQ